MSETITFSSLAFHRIKFITLSMTMHVLHTIKYLNKRNHHSTCHHARRQQVEFSNTFSSVSGGLRPKLTVRNWKKNASFYVLYMYTAVI